MNTAVFSRTPTSSGSVLLRGAFPAHRIPVSESSSDWVQDVTDSLERYIRLDRGWDGYQSVPVSLENANFVLKVLDAVCSEYTPAPQVVPGPNGEVQIEWHTDDEDIELLISKPYVVHAWRQKFDHGVAQPEEEFKLTNNFLEVGKWLGELTESSVALAAAA